ncbi:Na(+)/H(+) antiporter subunit B [Streptomyces caatingaensis]|uniref:MrpA C-terminal/MbhD domain-containing protein n=1 Tax=Streptomyces caatingaensis TaxID=1678637 RepID=A0A0K9XL26_9ACTN|nr:hydrogenase subunit MbhD domain-containing protein [Streptomyces caatingaensis]KNB54084.1 hypothetical protein AC230_06015 [Streptomyces caatingaensis]
MDDVLVTASLLFVAAAATAAVFNRDPARQAVVLSLLGLGLAVAFTVLQAPDVGLSQLGVGSALTPLMILLTVRKVRKVRRTEKGAGSGPGSGGGKRRR